MRRVTFMSLLFGAALAATPVLAEMAATQPPPAGPPAYGEQINIEQAKKAAAAAAEEAKKINTFMAIAVVSPSGDLVYFEKMDNTQYASITIAQHKARAAAIFRRPTKVFEDRVATPAGVPALTLDGVIASEGGIPLSIGGKIVGALGCSGGTGAQDGQTCQAGVDAMK
jgi:uncharacterized protein GlcG (DUF336 family)